MAAFILLVLYWFLSLLFTVMMIIIDDDRCIFWEAYPAFAAVFFLFCLLFLFFFVCIWQDFSVEIELWLHVSEMSCLVFFHDLVIFFLLVIFPFCFFFLRFWELFNLVTNYELFQCFGEISTEEANGLIVTMFIVNCVTVIMSTLLF